MRPVPKGIASNVIWILAGFCSQDVSDEYQSTPLSLYRIARCSFCFTVIVPHVVPRLNLTPVFEWYMARLMIKKGHREDMYDDEEIGSSCTQGYINPFRF